jgi:hypothetical protein
VCWAKVFWFPLAPLRPLLFMSFLWRTIFAVVGPGIGIGFRVGSCGGAGLLLEGSRMGSSGVL